MSLYIPGSAPPQEPESQYRLATKRVRPLTPTPIKRLLYLRTFLRLQLRGRGAKATLTAKVGELSERIGEIIQQVRGAENGPSLAKFVASAYKAKLARNDQLPDAFPRRSSQCVQDETSTSTPSLEGLWFPQETSSSPPPTSPPTPPSISECRSRLEVFFSESTFQRCAARYRALVDKLERVPKGSAARVLARAEGSKHACFRAFARSLGLTVSKDCRFNKKAFDIEMERVFGSLEKQGTSKFMYPGLQPLFLTAHNAGIIFSLYLGRKVWNTCDPRDIEKENLAFEARVCGLKRFCVNWTLPTEITSSILSYLDETSVGNFLSAFITRPNIDPALSCMRAIVDVLFTKKSAKSYPRDSYIPNSYKSCLERNQKDGGKRRAMYEDPSLPSPTSGVRYETIISGGKFRTITVDSVYNAKKFEFLNDYMFRRIRELPCMIAGRSVEAWLAGVDIPADDWILSGDLEAATDNFDPRLAEVVIDKLAELFFDGDPKAIEEMRAFTTRAKFLNREGLFQVSGQLMGSVLSFPILCLVNLVSQMLLHDVKPTRDNLYGFCGAGINGDDLVTWGGQDIGERWIHVLRLVGGKASRGKSLLNPVYFTVNSELFTRNGQIPVIRPSLISALNSGSFKSPNRHWNEYLSSPLRSSKTDAQFRPEITLFPNFPVSWGGTRYQKAEKLSEEFLIQACLLRAVKRGGISQNFSFVPTSRPNVTKDGHSTLVDFGLKRLDFEGCGVTGGFVKKDEVKEIGRKVYGIRHAAYWTERYSPSKSYDEILDETAEMYLGLTAYQRDILWREYSECWDYEERGYVWVRSIVDLGQEVIRGRWQGHVFSRSAVHRDAEDPYAWTYGDGEAKEGEMDVEDLPFMDQPE